MNINEYANNTVQRLYDKYGEWATTQHNKIRMKRKTNNTYLLELSLRGFERSTHTLSPF